MASARGSCALVGGTTPWDVLKFLPFRQLFRPLALLENPAHDQGVDEGKDDDSIRDSALLRSHLRARRSAHVVELACSRSVLCAGDRDTEALPEPDELGMQLLRGDIRIAIRQEGVEQIARVFVARRIVQAAAQRGDFPAVLQLLPVNLMSRREWTQHARELAGKGLRRRGGDAPGGAQREVEHQRNGCPLRLRWVARPPPRGSRSKDRLPLAGSPSCSQPPPAPPGRRS